MERENCNRLAEFRQLRKDIRGSDEHLIVGLDVAKERHNAFFGTATGEALYRRLIFDSDKDGFERLLLQAEAMKVQHGLKESGFRAGANGELPQTPWRISDKKRSCSSIGSHRGGKKEQVVAGWSVGQER
jgi:hypothetical protein